MHVRVQHVLDGDVELIPIGPNNALPRGINAQTRSSMMSHNAVRILNDDHDTLMELARQRDDFDYDEHIEDGDTDIDDEEQTDEEMEDGNSDDDDMDED